MHYRIRSAIAVFSVISGITALLAATPSPTEARQPLQCFMCRNDSWMGGGIHIDDGTGTDIPWDYYTNIHWSGYAGGLCYWAHDEYGYMLAAANSERAGALQTLGCSGLLVIRHVPSPPVLI